MYPRGQRGAPAHSPLCPPAASSTRGARDPKSRSLYPGQGQCPQDEASTPQYQASNTQCPFPVQGLESCPPHPPVLRPTGAKSCTPRCASPPPQSSSAAPVWALSPQILPHVMAAPPSHGTPKSPVVGQAPTGDSSPSRLPQLRQVSPKLVTLGLGGDRRAPLGDQGTG